ncbi:MAG: (Fe-S)-binding protein [Saprospiraceae bacterium]
MKIGLFIPCYIDQFYPQVGIATLELLERLGCVVEYPPGQTCCGQPLANTGMEKAAQPTYAHFREVFEGFDHIVAPSGSCVYHVVHHYPQKSKPQGQIWELCEFIVNHLGIQRIDAVFPHKVGLHPSCHGLRGMRLGPDSERVEERPDVVRTLLASVRDIELVDLDRRDECCGFGGTFAITEEAVSVRMGMDKIADHQRHGAEVITGTDVSCLMHLEGLIRRQGLPLRTMHIAELLNARA